MTVADLGARRGKGQMTMLYVETLDEAGAGAGIGILSIIAALWTPARRAAFPAAREK